MSKYLWFSMIVSIRSSMMMIYVKNEYIEGNNLTSIIPMFISNDLKSFTSHLFTSLNFWLVLNTIALGNHCCSHCAIDFFKMEKMMHCKTLFIPLYMQLNFLFFHVRRYFAVLYFIKILRWRYCLLFYSKAMNWDDVSKLSNFQTRIGY